MENKIIMPIQPIRDNRFVPNLIVEKLLETSYLDMNKIAVMDFTVQERIQFAQLIGYSLGGFSELSYVDDETYGAAEKMAEGISESQARTIELRDQLEEIRKGVKIAAAACFRIHPDDLRT